MTETTNYRVVVYQDGMDEKTLCVNIEKIDGLMARFPEEVVQTLLEGKRLNISKQDISILSETPKHTEIDRGVGMSTDQIPRFKWVIQERLPSTPLQRKVVNFKDDNGKPIFLNYTGESGEYNIYCLTSKELMEIESKLQALLETSE